MSLIRYIRESLATLGLGHSSHDITLLAAAALGLALPWYRVGSGIATYAGSHARLAVDMAIEPCDPETVVPRTSRRPNQSPKASSKWSTAYLGRLPVFSHAQF